MDQCRKKREGQWPGEAGPPPPDKAHAGRGADGGWRTAGQRAGMVWKTRRVRGRSSCCWTPDTNPLDDTGLLTPTYDLRKCPYATGEAGLDYEITATKYAER